MKSHWLMIGTLGVLLASGCKSGGKNEKQELPDEYFANRGVTRDSPEGRALAADPDPYWERNLRSKEKKDELKGKVASGIVEGLFTALLPDDDDEKKTGWPEPDLHPSRKGKKYE